MSKLSLPPVYGNSNNGFHLSQGEGVFSFKGNLSSGSRWADSFTFGADVPDTGYTPQPAATPQFLGHQGIIANPVDWLNPDHEADGTYARGDSSGPGGGGATCGYKPAPYTAGDPGAYNITVEFQGIWTEDLYQGFVDAADLLCTYIVGDVSDVFFRGDIVDDIVITAQLKDIDGDGGILGQAGPTALRTNGYLPAAASMQFDRADAPTYLNSNQWDDIVLHEMMHSIGFGTIWDRFGLVIENSATPALDYLYIGENASAVYGGPIPVEGGNVSGTSRSHWDEATFDNELMTGYINRSTYVGWITWASLGDLGYEMGSHPDYLVT